MKKAFSRNEGMTLVEVLIAIAILGLIVAPVSALFTNALENAALAKAHSDDRFRAESYMERIRQLSINELLNGGLSDNIPGSPFYFDGFSFDAASGTACYTLENCAVTISPYANPSVNSNGASYTRTVGSDFTAKKYDVYNSDNVREFDKAAFPVIDLRSGALLDVSKPVELNVAGLFDGTKTDESRIGLSATNLITSLPGAYYDMSGYTSVIRVPVYCDETSGRVTLLVTNGLNKKIELVMLNPGGGKPSFPEIISVGDDDTSGGVVMRDYTKYFSGKPVIDARGSLLFSGEVLVALGKTQSGGVSCYISGYSGIVSAEVTPYAGKIDMMALIDSLSGSVSVRIENNSGYELKLFIVNCLYNSDGSRDYSSLNPDAALPVLELVSGSITVIEDIAAGILADELAALANGAGGLISAYKVDIEINSEEHGRVYLEGIKTLN